MEYKGKAFTVPKGPQEIVDKFADLTVLQGVLDKIPEADRQKVGQISFEKDAINIVPSQMLGPVTLRVAQRTPQRVTLKAEGTPVPLSLAVNLAPKGDALTESQCVLDVDVPMMLRPMVAPHLSKAVDMVSDVMAKVLNS